MGFIVKGYHPNIITIFPMTDHPGIEEALSDFEAKISDLVKGMLEPLLGRWVKPAGFMVFPCFNVFACLTPRKFNIDTQEWPYLKGSIFSKASFWVSMKVFGGVNFLSLATSRS